MRCGWVYIMTNRRNGTLYLGVTSNIGRRVWEHRNVVADGFTKRYGLKRLVWMESSRHDHRRDPAGEDDEALAARVEGAPYRRRQSGLARPVRPAQSLNRTAGMDDRDKRGHDGW